MPAAFDLLGHDREHQISEAIVAHMCHTLTANGVLVSDNVLSCRKVVLCALRWR